VEDDDIVRRDDGIDKSLVSVLVVEFGGAEEGAE